MSWTNKPPVPTDGWSTALPAKQSIDLPIETVRADAARISDGWGAFVEEAKVNEHWPVTRPDLIHNEVDMTEALNDAAVATNFDAWSIHPNQTSPVITSYEEWAADENNYPPADAVEQLREAIWTANALDSANTKAGVVNALSGNKDHFNIDQDGELTRLQEITKSVSPGPYGYYVAYHNGRWLHAILSGPYESKDAAMLQAPKAYDMMTNDAAFKLAFENKFYRSGIYCAEIPLSAKRKGAYGVLSYG